MLFLIYEDTYRNMGGMDIYRILSMVEGISLKLIYITVS